MVQRSKAYFMSDLFLIFNHEITSLQQEDARENLGVDRIVDLPPDLKKLWRRIPPDLEEIGKYLEPVKRWLSGHASQSDYVLIQGDFGACYMMVNFAIENGLIPVYSTTHREVAEEYGENGSVNIIHRFKHVAFREYGMSGLFRKPL